MKSQKGLSTVMYSRRWDIPIIKLKYSIIRICTISDRKKRCTHYKQRHFECDLLKMTKMLASTLLFSGREMIPYVKEIDGKFHAFSLYIVVSGSFI